MVESKLNAYRVSRVATIGFALASLTGCGKQVAEKDGPAHSVAAAAVDVHPEEGPHHGDLIELGEEEYHAEMVHDEGSGTLSIYLLDSAGKTATPVDAKELVINVRHDGNAEQFTLAARAEDGDPAGQASRFSSTDAELAEALDSEESEAALVVTINGKQFRGAIAHDHEEHVH